MKYIIFNWKSYLNLKETISLSKIISNLPSSKKFKLVSSPNNFFNLAIKSRFPKNTLATQNIDFHGSGANTGSMNINHLIENKIKYSILGHSEVRSNFGDSDTIVKIKLDLCLSHNIIPIVCVGETKDVYKSKKTKIFLKSQINKIFDKSTSYNEVILAYEPL